MNGTATSVVRCVENPELPFREPGQLAIPSPPNQFISLPRLHCSRREFRRGYALTGAGLAAHENPLRFDTGSTTSPCFTFSDYCFVRVTVTEAEAGIGEEILQHVIQRYTYILPREPRGVRETPRSAEQDMCLCWGCEQSEMNKFFVFRESI